MSSVARGDAFEKKVFDAVSKELAADRLGLSPRYATVHRNKPYHSRDRNSAIVVDVSVEVWLPGAKNFSFLWVCECKDYTGSLAVNEVEEFKAKLDQIAGVNKKGILAITGALQRSTLNYARANGIAILRLLPDDQVRYQIHMTRLEARLGAPAGDAEDGDDALTQPAFIGRNRDLYANSDGRDFGEWKSFLAATVVLPEDQAMLEGSP
jgi:hypothetical protein